MNLTRIPFIAVATLIGLAAAVGLFVLPRMQNRDAPCAIHDFENSRFLVCTYDARRQDMRLYSRAPGSGYLRSFATLQSEMTEDQLRAVRFAMNAGMFNDAGAPIGLYVEDGEEQKSISLTEGPGNFHLKPNGVFWQGLDGALHIDVSEDFAREMREPRWATQSGPMLVINGEMHPRFADDGTSRFIRNGVGVSDQYTAYFVISSGFVSFGRFARFFRDELNCRNALFLDGTVSSIWAPSVGRYDDNHELGPMVVISDRD